MSYDIGRRIYVLMPDLKTIRKVKIYKSPKASVSFVGPEDFKSGSKQKFFSGYIKSEGLLGEFSFNDESLNELYIKNNKVERNTYLDVSIKAQRERIIIQSLARRKNRVNKSYINRNEWPHI